MSRERARRRAEREAAAEVERARRERVLTRRRRRAAITGSLTRVITAPLGRVWRRPVRRHPTVLGRRRARENGSLLAVLLAAHTVLWLVQPSWWVRGSALILTVLFWPVLIVLLFDRRT